MGMPWNNTVRAGGRLSVQLNAALSSPWRTACRNAIRDLNLLSRRHRLGVSLREARTGTPEVLLATINGTLRSSHGGTAYSVTVNGRQMHGRTIQATRQSRIERAFVYLPATPQISTPRGPRGVGEGVMRLIAAHELVHAMGLVDADHDRDGLFQGYPQVDYGPQPARDRVLSPSGRMPPLRLSSSTAGKVRRLWSTRSP